LGIDCGGCVRQKTCDFMMASSRCWAEIDLDALGGNLLWIRRRVGAGVRVLTVVKADAYGHGLRRIAAHLMEHGTDVFGVANLAEARAIRALDEGCPILMLGACMPDEVEETVRDRVMPTLSSVEEGHWFSSAAMRLGVTVSVQVKVDTGMGRLGMIAEEAAARIDEIRQLPGLQLEGVYTHFAVAEEDADFSAWQRLRFETLLADLRGRGLTVPCVHGGNSAVVLHQPDCYWNLVRPGLLVYGVVPPGSRRDVGAEAEPVRPVMSLRCRVSFLKAVNEGQSLSYGRTFVAEGPLRVATLTAGYGDGYPRAASNRAMVLVGGRRCRVLGRVTMDQTLVDVTGLDGVRIGDEGVLFGHQGEETITVNELAAWCGMVPWELLTGISYRVPRVYRGGSTA
jgi:alanine racemase